MSWLVYDLGEILTLKRGYDLPHQSQKEGVVPVVSSSGITGYHNVEKVEGPAVVTGRYDTLGEVYFVDRPCWPLNTALYVKDFRGNRPKFIYYFLQTILKGMRSDKAAVPGVNRNDLHARKVKSTKDHFIQKSIENFVGAYDDLIENNRRRIQLLEESARLLYQDWFAHLRFPGHEQMTITDGVPEGWQKKTLKQIATLNYGKALKAEIRVPGPYPVYGSSGKVGCHEIALVKGPGIVVGRKGNVGSIYWVNTDFFPIDTVYFISEEESDLFLYHALQNVQFINTDVAVPGLNRDMAYSREILIPDNKNYQRFLAEVQSTQDQINKLQDYNNKLAQARDLLLPKLMSGELTV